MKIGLVCPYSFDVPGGVGTHVLGLSRWLRREGHNVLVVGPGTEPSTEHYLRLGRSLAFRFNGSTANLAILPSQAKEAVEALADVDVVHVHEPLTPGLAFATARAAKRLIVTHHANYNPGPFALLLRARAACLGRRVSLAVSPAAATTARRVTGVRPTIVPNAIDLPEFTERTPSRVPVVLFVGRRDDPRKGYPIFTAVAERMADEARFVAVGPGARNSEFVAEYGPVDPDTLDSWFRHADVLLAPNTHGESFGLIMVEALARGCGVVASQLPAFRTLAGEHPAFEWFKAGDVDGAVGALRRRFRDPIDVREAHAFAKEYSWERIGPRIVEQYANVGIK